MGVGVVRRAKKSAAQPHSQALSPLTQWRESLRMRLSAALPCTGAPMYPCDNVKKRSLPKGKKCNRFNWENELQIHEIF